MLTVVALVTTGAGCGDRDPVQLDPPVGSVAFFVVADTIVAGTMKSITVDVRADGGGAMPGMPVVWGSTDAAIATVDTAGRVTGRYPGLTRIIAEVRGVADTLTLTVTPAPVGELSLGGVAGRLVEGARASLTTTLRAPNGAVISDPRQIHYASSAPHVALVDTTGVVYALAPGQVIITATSERRAGTLALEVVRADVASLDVRAGAAMVAPGRALQLSVTPRDDAGRALAARTITYHSSDASVVSVSSSGLVTGHAVGEASIAAESEGVAVETTMRVVAPPTSAFAIDVRLLGSPPIEVADAVRMAAARWSRVIVGDLPDMPLALPADACFDDTPAVDEMVDDLLLFVRVGEIDGAGGVLGHAGPCVVRQGGLPAVGIIVIDAADLAWAVADGITVDLISHELGHVLGIGSFWDGTPATVGLRTTNPGFVGAASRTAQAAIGYSPDADVPVPIENDGGPGTRDVHWRDRVFGAELMTGWLNAHRNPLSLITVEALADLGYLVTPAGAEPFAYVAGGQAGSDQRGSGQLSRSGMAMQERQVSPRWRLGVDGRLTRIE